MVELTKLEDALRCKKDILHLHVPEHVQWQAQKDVKDLIPVYNVALV